MKFLLLSFCVKNDFFILKSVNMLNGWEMMKYLVIMCFLMYVLFLQRVSIFRKMIHAGRSHALGKITARAMLSSF